MKNWQIIGFLNQKIIFEIYTFLLNLPFYLIISIWLKVILLFLVKCIILAKKNVTIIKKIN